MSSEPSAASDKQLLTPENLPPASLMRLLGAWFYDFMLLCAVWLLAGVVYLIPAQMFAKVDSTQTASLSTTEFSGPLFYIYLLIVTWFFFAWFWTHGGQTLGLRTWSLRLQTNDGALVNWAQTLLRFLLAGAPWILALFVYDYIVNTLHSDSPYQYAVFLIGFAGLIWKLVDKKNRSLQDIFSNTRIVKLPKQSNKVKTE